MTQTKRTHKEYCINLNFDFFSLIYRFAQKKTETQNYFERKTGVCKRSSLSADTIGIFPDL
jgi:hypothetical protein